MSHDTSEYDIKLKTQASMSSDYSSESEYEDGKLKTQDSSSDSSSDSENEVTVIDIPKIVDGLRKKAKTMDTDELIEVHFKNDFDRKNIKRWRDDPSFWLPKIECPISLNVPCAVCNKLAFSRKLRGDPIRPLEWFMDKDSDAYFLLLDPINHEVKNEIFSDLRFHEQALRMIPRRKVLECICDRFRGFKRQEQDKIDLLYNFHHFKSLEERCGFKEQFDKFVLMKIEEKRSRRLYCCGCGVRAKCFTSKKGEFYERCANRKCSFFHKLGSKFATVDTGI